MPLITLDAKIENAKLIKGMRGRWAAVKKSAMTEVARSWLERIFPGHFQAGNQTRYPMEPRAKFYKQVIKKIEGVGEGKSVDLILKGKSRRYLRTSARITATQNRATLYMQGPPYFANPFIGRIEKEVPNKSGSGTHKITVNIRRQPDKVKELTQINPGDRRTMTAVLRSDIQGRVNQLLGTS